jgi:hypothetical protein
MSALITVRCHPLRVTLIPVEGWRRRERAKLKANYLLLCARQRLRSIGRNVGGFSHNFVIIEQFITVESFFEDQSNETHTSG